MHRLYIILFIVFLSTGTAFGQETKKEENTPQKIEKLQNSPKSTSNSLIHRFVCQRCGSENQLNWGFPTMDKHLELIPHCGFCGKKYWPKFKPTGMLQRTYCRTDSVDEAGS